jgi:hypothetical protein
MLEPTTRGGGKMNKVRSITDYDIDMTLERLGKLKEMLEMTNPALLENFNKHIDAAIKAIEIAYER